MPKFLLIVEHDWLDESGPFPLSTPLNSVKEVEDTAKAIHKKYADERYDFSFKIWEIRNDFSIHPISEFQINAAGDIEDCTVDVLDAESYLEMLAEAE